MSCSGWRICLNLAVALGFMSCPEARGQLGVRSFLQLEPPPVNYRPVEGGPVPQPGAVLPVIARPDGLVFVGAWELDKVYVIDARDASNPLLIIEVPMPNLSDTEGLAFDGVRDRVWVGGDNQVIGSADNGLYFLDIPINPFSAASWATVVPEIVPGVETGVTPNIFTGSDGRRYLLIVNRWCEPPRIVDITDPVPVVEPTGTWTFADPAIRMSDASVFTTSSGQILAAVATHFAGVHVVDLTAFPAGPPSVITHFDWTFEPPDFDGNPATVDGCDRNGDGDILECGEAGRAGGDGLRVSSCIQARFVEIGSPPSLYLVTIDSTLAGHVRVWAWDDILAGCPDETTCTDDLRCGGPRCSGSSSACGVPPPALPNPWPVVDEITPVAFFQIDKCPLATTSTSLERSALFAAYAEDGAVVIDLAAQGLAYTGALPVPEMTPLAAFDILPADSDTVMENYPCHPVGQSEVVPIIDPAGCESRNNEDWNPTPCPIPPDPGPGEFFRVIMNVGQRSAADVEWSGCRLYVTDWGTPDADELPAPSHQGTPEGLWILDFGTDGLGDVGPSLRIGKVPGAAATPDLLLAWADVALAAEFKIQRGTIPATATMTGYDHDCVFRDTDLDFGEPLPDQISEPVAPRPTFYYLVTASCGSTDGTYGTDSFGVARPASTGACP